ncbi:peptidylprolyl isomerase [Brevundimonas sp. GN22]|uniref:peptidylprolyl isomerase n=1 Tax=Brevundimonas pishanensis TaxID=2896315 RepID=UPI001FA7802E|nr:peptidylprolyl isomerase [Brevundimonas pishanensis]
MKPALVLVAAAAALFGLAPLASAAVDTPSAADFEQVPPENLLVIDTTKGRIWIEMTPDVAPLHVERLRLLAREGFYNNVKWHRVIDGFMAQTGDPTGTGEGESSHPDLKAEFTFRRGADTAFTPFVSPAGYPVGLHNSLPMVTQPDRFFTHSEDRKATAWAVYCPGVAGMARDDDPDSANSQFFLMRDYYPTLERRYSVWGRVVAGQDVVNSLNAGALPSGMVENPDLMLRVQVASDMAVAERPQVYRARPDGQAFKAAVADIMRQKGAEFSVCDVPVPMRIVDPA